MKGPRNDGVRWSGGRGERERKRVHPRVALSLVLLYMRASVYACARVLCTSSDDVFVTYV
jgi:hypothetical protein